MSPSNEGNLPRAGFDTILRWFLDDPKYDHFQRLAADFAPYYNGASGQ
jgi:hypothetical protein